MHLHGSWRASLNTQPTSHAFFVIKTDTPGYKVKFKSTGGTNSYASTPEIIIENGGDIFLKSLKKRMIGIYAGKSPLSGRIGLEISGEETPIGICTSSGTVGHSLSYGKADAVIVLSPSATLADAAATAIGNVITQQDNIPMGIELAKA
ncbi:unnamed protein product, partial [marine sediment metagenome]